MCGRVCPGKNANTVAVEPLVRLIRCLSRGGAVPLLMFDDGDDPVRMWEGLLVGRGWSQQGYPAYLALIVCSTFFGDPETRR